MTEISEKENIILLLENEDDIYGNTPGRCLAISGKMSGFSGAKLFEKAARALKKILEEV